MTTPPLRIGNAEREVAVRELGEHYAAGRLDPQEYEERTTAAYAARSADDLTPLFADLPRDQATVAIPQPPTPAVPPAPSYEVDAPYGRHPVTGQPYSDRHKIIAGVLQLVIPMGIGRFYTGHTGIAIAQLLLSFILIGAIWSFIDGIVILAGNSTDRYGRPLRP
jgi:TM2 domain-containing membrane protein YozV